jgi:competence protein ComEC
VNSVSLIWTTITVFLISGYLFTSSKVFLIFLAIWILRLGYLRNISVMMQVTLIATCFFIHFNHQIKLIQQAGVPQTNVEIKLRVHPDAIKPMDGGISVRAFDNQVNHLGAQAFISIEDATQLSAIANTEKDIELTVQGDVSPIDLPTNINQFDFRRIMYGKKIYFKITKANLQKVQISNQTNLITKMHCWRKKLIKHCQSLPEPLQSYCLGIILGEQTDYLKENSGKLRDMGIIHLFCISGLHVFYFVKLIEHLAILLRMKRETMELVQIGILPIYFVLGGGSTSLLRAVMLVLVQLITQKLKIKGLKSLDVWCMVLLFNLWVNPLVLLQMGGQLSYLLSFVLIMQVDAGNVKMAFDLFLVELPIILFSTYKIHALTMLFNLVIVPVFSSVIVPITIISFAIPWLAGMLNPVIKLFELVLKVLDLLPGLIQVGKPPRWLVLVALVMALKLISANRCLMRKWLSRTYILLWFSVWSWFKLNPFGEVSFFDVGQGDSILIREPFNRSVTMVDTGGKVQFGKHSQPIKHTIAKNSSINYLQSIGIKQIDNLCLTHQDMDHIGEASEILTNLKVKRLVFPVGVEATGNYHQNIEPFVGSTKVITVLKGVKIPKLPMQIMYPFQPGKGENGDSLALHGMLGGKSFLLTGDLDVKGEHELVASGLLNQHVDVFKLGHHGSKTANSEELLQAITPKLTVISAGRNNRYGHPNQEVIDRLDQLKIPHVSTQDKGMISYRYFFNGVGRWKTGIDEKGSIVQ